MNRIKAALERAGLDSIPSDPSAPLSDFDIDSLRAVMIVAELESEFGVKISAQEMRPDSFSSLRAIEKLLAGAQRKAG